MTLYANLHPKKTQKPANKTPILRGSFQTNSKKQI